MHTLTKPEEKNMKYLIIFKFDVVEPNKWHFHDDCGCSEFKGEKQTEALRDALADMYPRRTYKILPLLDEENLEKQDSPVKGVK